MKIGIIGPAERSVAWEKHLRPHRLVSEVRIAATLDDIGTVDACFLLDETPARLNNLLNTIKLGIPTFLVSTLPSDSQLIEKIYHASQEANVQIQFSHWPTLAPATQWMVKQISTPNFIQVRREMSYTSFLESNISLEDLWIDEVAYCAKYIGGAVHHSDINISKLKSGKAYSMHVMLRFNSGATAGIYISVSATENNHTRFVANNALQLECNVGQQTVRLGKENASGHLYFEKKLFDPSLAAEQSAIQFLKAIQLNNATLYNSYDLHRLSRLVDQIKGQS